MSCADWKDTSMGMYYAMSTPRNRELASAVQRRLLSKPISSRLELPDMSLGSASTRVGGPESDDLHVYQSKHSEAGLRI